MISHVLWQDYQSMTTAPRKPNSKSTARRSADKAKNAVALVKSQGSVRCEYC